MALRHAISPSKRSRNISINPAHKESPNPVADYLTKASDTLGRSVSISVTMSPEVRRIASMLLAKQLFPFETEPDVWRWCIYHGLKELVRRSEDESMTSSVRKMNAVMRMARQEVENAYYEKHFDLMRRSVRALIEKGHLVKARQVADEIWTSHDSEEDPYWRKEWRGMAKSLLDEVRAAEEEYRR